MRRRAQGQRERRPVFIRAPSRVFRPERKNDMTKLLIEAALAAAFLESAFVAAMREAGIEATPEQKKLAADKFVREIAKGGCNGKQAD